MDYKLSILIPTKNRKKLLERALNSVCNQSVLADEVIVVNDGSNDDTKIFIESFVKLNPQLNIVFIDKPESGGVNTARNQGLNIAKSDWVAFLDDDDEFLSDAIQKIKNKIKEIPPNIDVVYFNTLIDKGDVKFNGGFQFDKVKIEEDFYDPSYEETMLKFNLKGDCKPVFRKSLFDDKKYLFPESVNGFESYTMNLIARDGMGIRYINDIVTYVHQEPNLSDRLSLVAPKKKPLPLLVLHLKQIPQHFYFYIKHPFILLRKIIEMTKLFGRVIFSLE